MRRALLFCAAIAFAIACGDDITEPIPDRTLATPPVAFATTTTEDGLSISTDKDDYAPGDTVHFTGSGWQPGDVLDIVLTDDPLTHDPHTWSVDVGADGMFHDSTYVVDEGDLNVTFTLVATSRATGRSLTVVFTDGNIGSVSFTFFPGGSATGGTATTGTGCTGAAGTSVAVGSQICARASFNIASPPVNVTEASIRWVNPSGTVVAVNARSPGFASNITGAQSFAAAFTPTVAGTWTVLLCESNNTSTSGGGANGCTAGPERGRATFIVRAITFTSFTLFPGGATSGSPPTGCTGASGTSVASGTPICARADFTLSGTNSKPVSIRWRNPSNTVVDVDARSPDFAGGTTGAQTFAGAVTPSVTGTWTVLLCESSSTSVAAPDAAGCPASTERGSATFTVTAANQSPVVDAGGPYAGNKNAAIPLNGASASDPDGDVLTYLWTVSGVPAGTTCNISNATSLTTASLTCNQVATVTVTLTVNDGKGGSASDAAQVTITNSAPVANAHGPYSGNEGSPVALSGSGTDPDGDTFTFKWTYAPDVGVDAGAGCSFSPNDATASPTITCTDDGTFKVTLTLTDTDGEKGTSVADVVLANVKPTATFNTPAGDVNEGSTFALSLTGATDASSNDVTAGLKYAFDCGSGYSATDYATASTTNNFTCNTAVDGPATLNVKGKVFDKDDGVNEYTGTVKVKNVPPTANAGGPYSGDEGDVIPLDGTGDDVSAADKATLTYAWSVDFTGIDDGGSCKFYDPAHPANAATATSTLEDPSIKCDDDSHDGVFKLKLIVSDKDGGSSTPSYADLKVNNVGPVAKTGGPYDGDEGEAIELHGSATDVGANDTKFEWKWEYTAGEGFKNNAKCEFNNAALQEPTITCNDNGTVKLTLIATDDNGADSDPAYGTLEVANVAPVAYAQGPYTDNEGAAIQLDGKATDAGKNDTHTFAWSVNTDGIDANGKCLFYNPAYPGNAGTQTSTLEDPTIKCDDDSNGGTFKLSLTVTDDDGDSSTPSEATLTVLNVAPTVVVSPSSKTIDEGGTASFTATVTDPGANDVATFTFAWSTTVGACSVTSSTIAGATFSCNDNGSGNVKLTVNDQDPNGEGFGQAALTVNNVNPIVTIITPADYSVWSINGFAGVSNFVNASFSDVGTSDTHTCKIDWGNGVIDNGVITETNGSGSCKLTPSSNPYMSTGAGVYTMTVKVKDDDYGEGSASRTLIVYDPAAGFVTGGGWFNSPAWAYVANPTLTGKANFGFVSKYTKNSPNTPIGNTEFQFQAGNLNFHSENYDWLLVTKDGTNAQYKGTGTINGAGSYKFMLWAADGGGFDTFRMKIWYTQNNVDMIVYDNMASAGGGFSTVPIGGGSIVIHTNGGLANK